MSSSESPVALITGAGRGIGRAIALAFAQRGYRLVLAARSYEELIETRARSGRPAAESLIVLIDLAEADAPANLIQTTLDFYGRLDVLVNNAGWAPARHPLVKTREADQDRMIAVNLRAPVALARHAASHMIERKSGTIINIASLAGALAPPGEAIYAATKAGLIAFSRSCFAELRGHGVRVSVVLPGLVDTALIPPNKHLRRSHMLTPQQVAEAVMHLVESPAGVCPVELTIMPQQEPESAS